MFLNLIIFVNIDLIRYECSRMTNTFTTSIVLLEDIGILLEIGGEGSTDISSMTLEI